MSKLMNCACYQDATGAVELPCDAHRAWFERETERRRTTNVATLGRYVSLQALEHAVDPKGWLFYEVRLVLERFVRETGESPTLLYIRGSKEMP
jgi:hypothetical protein